jgi:hypothetical protein
METSQVWLEKWRRIASFDKNKPSARLTPPLAPHLHHRRMVPARIHAVGVVPVTEIQGRRLLKLEGVATLLQLSPDQVQWLVDTSQLRPIRICGEIRFDTRDVFQLIDAYRLIQEKGDDHGKQQVQSH